LTENQRIIAGRYTLGNLIGRGGMADVYEGVDTRLGRTVAIKMLKSDLANDPAFEARFRQEAQASARMAHPTIVRVYDAGEEINTDANGNQRKYPFIVMEFVKGKLLRELLHERRLSLQETLDYSIGVLTALEFSHRAGVIHRDIKSANIMINEAGQIKVMDFGIARAVSESSATVAHTAGIVGTAQYFSPEQAKGEDVDARTDLYSTGVLLYEMLCGRPPFKGESAVSVAYQHVSEPVLPPSHFDSNISAALDAVALRALEKNREQRFQTAQEFREHLIAAATGAAMPTPLANETQTAAPEPTPAPVEENPAANDFEAMLAAAGINSTTAINTSDSESAQTQNLNSGWNDLRTPATNPFSSLGVEMPTNTGSTSRPIFADENRPSTSLMVTIGTAVSVVLIGLMVWFVAFSNLSFNIAPGGGIAVADVVGKTYTDGYSTLTAQSLLVSKVAEPNDTIPVDTIIRTDPPAGTSVAERQMITVYVSSGANHVKIPSLTGLTESEAAGVLATLKLTLGTITQGNSGSVESGNIIESIPALNTEVPEGSAVNLIVSNGKVMVPDVRNLAISEARNIMSAPDVALPVSITTRDECAGTPGTIVVEQSIAPGLAPQRSAIILYVGCEQ
jgi:serine/threonine-protein kinase